MREGWLSILIYNTLAALTGDESRATMVHTLIRRRRGLVEPVVLAIFARFSGGMGGPSRFGLRGTRILQGSGRSFSSWRSSLLPGLACYPNPGRDDHWTMGGRYRSISMILPAHQLRRTDIFILFTISVAACRFQSGVVSSHAILQRRFHAAIEHDATLRPIWG